MEAVQNQCRILRENGAPWNDLLKAIDEYNYCKYTLDPDPDPVCSSEPDLRHAEEPQKDIESMTDEEVDRELAALTSTDTAKSAERRNKARQRAKQQRELLTELKRLRADGELIMLDPGH